MVPWLWALLMAAGAGALEPGFQACKRALNVSVLEVLPGGGWDNLRNVEVGRVMSLNYSQCRTTEDGEYLLPDEVEVVPLRESRVEVNAELIENWLSYTDAFARSINAEASFLGVLNGKFSSGCQETKTYNVYDQTVTTRVQVRHHIYSVKAQPAFTLHPSFRHQLLAIGNQLENNQSQTATYLAELLVLNYGTHVLTRLEAGASLIQEDQVKLTFLQDKVAEKASITASASATFFGKVNVGIGAAAQVQDELTKSYMENTVDSHIESRGSVPFYPGITLQKWQEGIPNHLVAIGKAGLPLPFFISPEALPELPAPTAKRVAAVVDKAIHLYYAINTHPGCIKADASNFNFQANVDDGSCLGASTNFSFGGVFQKCRGVSGLDGEEMCQPYRTQNPLTGGFSCPAGFTPVPLHSEERTASKPQAECHEECHSCWLFFSCCHKECGVRYYSTTVRFTAHWCAATGPVPQGSGFLFGGLYSAGEENPLTGARACPSYFYPLSLFDGLKVCVSDDYEMGARFGLPFGGFFSCQAGNPLAGPLKGQSPGLLQDFFYQDSDTAYPMKCPQGYSQHKAYLSDGCQILYCLQAGSLFAQQLAPIKLPPFLRQPSPNASMAETILVLGEGSQAWVKLQGSGRWRSANVTDEREMAQLFQAQSSAGPTGGAVAGISVAVTLVLAAAIAGAVYGTRRYKSRGYQEVQPPSRLVEEQESYGSTTMSLGTSSA
ncbi:transmembrane protein 51 [Platysternon megacephalum]|uniref:Transmembrane protein 51 n=1 Tax=Platysternon megacephalum TaxID=55544 RepID=A0A4D9DG27_9SAUR|nr:transmembrane protein 51 [Platysternon megacephalum]